MVSYIPNFPSLFSPFLSHSYFLSPYPPMAMNTNNTLCLVSTMDRLWYHQIILCSDPFTSSHIPNFLNPTSSFPFTNFPSSPLSPLMDQTIILPSSSLSSSSSPSVSSDNISLVSQEDYSTEEHKNKQDAKRESSEDQSLNNLKFSVVGRKLNKSTSCKSLGELELEEVKGFMDLGFEFKRENLSPQMVKLVPGLQRLRTQINKQNLEEDDDDDDDDDGDDNDNDEENDDDDNDKKREITRPYLSEAWIIKRPNSPLLNLRMPKVSSTSDMKKHLKSWAKTVAFEIQ